VENFSDPPALILAQWSADMDAYGVSYVATVLFIVSLRKFTDGQEGNGWIVLEI